MLRAFAVALVVLNLLFFSWAQGLLAPAFPAPRHAEREPGRLAAQVRPETVAVRPPPAGTGPGSRSGIRSGTENSGATERTTGAAGVAPVCLQSGPLPPVEVAAAEAVLASEQVARSDWVRVEVTPSGAASDSRNARTVLRVQAADAALRSRLLALPGTALAGGFRPCDG